MKLEKAKGWVKMLNVCCFEVYNPGQKVFFVRLFFFKIMKIIQIFLRWLGMLNFDP